MEKNNYQFLILFTVFLLFFPLGVFAGSGIIFDVTEWNTGLLDSGSVFEKDVSVANNTADNIQFHLLPGCGCLTVSEETFLVNAGSQKTFTIYFDTTDEDFGPFEKYIIIRTNSETLKKGLFAVKGSIADNLTGSSDEKKSSNEDAVDTEPSNSKFEYYYLPGCKSCAHFLSNIKYPVDKFDITNSEVYEKLQKRLSEQDIELNEVPVLFINGKPFQGEKTINNAYQAFCEGSSLDSITNTKPEKTTASTLSGFSVALAGLLDGVNPCAFTTLIFLISALSVAGRNRRGIFTVGLFYTLTVFVTYFLIGLGFFKIIRLAESFSLVSSIIRWLLFAVLLLFAALSFYDFQKVVSGNSHNI
ncbi:MAG: hypothetical protein PQJ46_00695, partial [Spirochaetales bacterium]|nr:hypothetical protein [Spirochaetales bacterium]